MLTEQILKENFGRQVKTLRQAANLTQSNLAGLTGISEEYLSKVERGLASPSFAVLASLAQTLGVAPSRLFSFSINEADGGFPAAQFDTVLVNLFENLPFGACISSVSGHFIAASSAFAKVLGYASQAQLLGDIKDIAKDIYLDSAERSRVLDSLPRDGSPRLTTVRLRGRDGSPLSLRMTLRRVSWQDAGEYCLGRVESLLGQGRGEQSWWERFYTLALRELHHRVKNNFAMLKSFLDLEAVRHGQTSGCREVLDSVGHKMLAAARLHDRLYSGECGDMLDLQVYLADVLEPLRTAFAEPRQIFLELDCPPCTMEWSQALRLGLLVVELATNALKHAYPISGQTTPGRVVVRYQRADGRSVLDVEDHGLGLDVDLGTDSAELRLVRGLVSSLDGQLSIRSVAGHGTMVQVVMPAK